MARELHRAHPAATLWIVPDAEHGMSYYVDPEGYLDHLDRFLRETTAPLDARTP